MAPVLLAIVFLSTALYAEDPTPLILSDTMDAAPVNAHIDLYVDQTGDLTFHSVRTASFHPTINNSFGYTDATYWLRLKVKNPDADVRRWYLELDYSVFDSIKLYSAERGLLYHTGDHVPFHQRPVLYRTYMFPLVTPADSTETYYLQLKSRSSMTFPLLAYSESNFQKTAATEQIAYGFYYGAMVIMFIYNLFIFFATRDLSYLYYILYIGFYIIFQAILNGLAFQYLWPDSVWWANQSLPVFIFCTVFMGMAFGRSFLNAAMHAPLLNRLYMILFAATILGAIVSLFVPYYYIIIIAIGVCFPAVTLIFSNGVAALLKGQRSARFFLLAWITFLTGIILYALKSFGVIPTNAVTTNAIQVGAGVEVVLLSLALADRINELSRNLSNRVDELNEARAVIEKSERRYRDLIEGDDDYIFMLDENWRIQGGNRAIRKLLGFLRKDVLSMDFRDLLYKHPEREDFNRVLVSDKLNELEATGNSVQFYADFRQKHVMEPRELHVSLQFIAHEDRREVLGRMSDPAEDTLVRFLDSETQVYDMNNYLHNVELLGQRLTDHLRKYLDAGELMGVKNCLREILINAVEHGNLNISFDEKTRATEQGNYLHFIQERQNDPRYRDRRVRVEYTLDAHRVGFRITDEGAGFDWRDRVQEQARQAHRDRLMHGRGIMMTRAIFDEVQYNDRGNQVVLIKYFRDPAALPEQARRPFRADLPVGDELK
ncbi:MAG: ATP-binding protein [Leptospiraceae bacterium]|nr:ATP-binding protein [Leptospiraceae bacterium]